MNFKDLSRLISNEQPLTKKDALYLLSNDVDLNELLSVAYP